MRFDRTLTGLPVLTDLAAGVNSNRTLGLIIDFGFLFDTR